MLFLPILRQVNENMKKRELHGGLLQDPLRKKIS